MGIVHRYKDNQQVRAASAKYIPFMWYLALLLLTAGQEEWILNQISSGQCIPSEIALKNETGVQPSP